MATEENLRSISRTVDSSLGIYTGPPGMPGSASPNIGKQYRFVKLTGTKQVGQCTDDGDIIVGILQNKPQQAGAAGTIGYEGESLVVAGEDDISAGDLLVPDTSGRAIAGTPAAGSQVWQAVMPSSAVGELISAMKL